MSSRKENIYLKQEIRKLKRELRQYRNALSFLNRQVAEASDTIDIATGGIIGVYEKIYKIINNHKYFGDSKERNYFNLIYEIADAIELTEWQKDKLGEDCIE